MIHITQQENKKNLCSFNQNHQMIDFYKTKCYTIIVFLQDSLFLLFPFYSTAINMHIVQIVRMFAEVIDVNIHNQYC